MEIICLIIPHLNKDVLFGCNWFFKYKAHINFESLMVEFDAYGKRGAAPSYCKFIEYPVYIHFLRQNIGESAKEFVEMQKPKWILSDNGTLFSAHRLGEKLHEAGIKVKFMSVFFLREI